MLILKCPICGSKTVLTTKTGRICRKCGYKGPPEEFVEGKK